MILEESEELHVCSTTKGYRELFSGYGKVWIVEKPVRKLVPFPHVSEVIGNRASQVLQGAQHKENPFFGFYSFDSYRLCLYWRSGLFKRRQIRRKKQKIKR